MSKWVDEALSGTGLRSKLKTLGDADKISGMGLDKFHSKRKEMGHWAMGLSSKRDVRHEEEN